MNNTKKTNIIVGVIMAISLVGLIILYPSLPQTIPTHWNIHGEIDGTGSKQILLLLWALPLFFNLLMPVVEKIDPKSENYPKFRKVYNIFRIVFTLFMTVVLFVNIMFIFNPDFINMNSVVMPLMGVLFAIIGNYMPKVKHNYSFGIKLPWTLASENVWNKTHRMAGPLWMGTGVILVVIGLFAGENTALITVVMPVMLVCMIAIPTVYSYIEFKKEKESMNDEKDS